MQLLHVFGQGAWHDEVAIVGNREALETLRDTIDAALKRRHDSAMVTTNDGEGYEVHVLVLEDREKMDKLILPYTEECACINWQDPKVIKPYDLVKEVLGGREGKEV